MGRWMEELRELQAMIPEGSDILTSSIPPEPVAAVLLPSPVATPQPILQIRPGWLVAYRDRHGTLSGGCDDRKHGTVRECQWDGMAWTVLLTDGQWLPLTSIRSVGKTNGEGKIVAAWTVREHGYDGKGRPSTSGEAG